MKEYSTTMPGKTHDEYISGDVQQTPGHNSFVLHIAVNIKSFLPAYSVYMYILL